MKYIPWFQLMKYIPWFQLQVQGLGDICVITDKYYNTKIENLTTTGIELGILM